jgi:peptidoglycan-associated lipoprotein
MARLERNMLATVTQRVLMLSFGVGLILMISGCNPRELTVSSTDRVYVPSPKELAEQEGRKAAEAKAESPAPMERSGTEPASSSAAREVEKPAASSTQPLEEVRVAEPPIETPGVRQPSESAGAPAAGPPPMVAQAIPPAVPDAETGSRPPASATVSSSSVPLEDVFFDYDRYLIRGDAKSVLQANARVLRSDEKLRILIEGHCDEHGTSEYNLVLGEKRARAAKQYLQDLGVEASRIEITSLGKERPFCTEHIPTCWQKNRRAHFVAQ